MYKKPLLFLVTILVAFSTSTGYGSSDILKGDINPATFLDWFTTIQKYVPLTGLIILDIIPIMFLLIQTIIFFQDKKKVKGILAITAIVVNVIGAILLIQFANPIASQISSWSLTNLPTDWITVKDEWIKYIGLHGLFGMIGWLCFVTTYYVDNGTSFVERRLPRVLNFLKHALTFFLTFLLGLGTSRLLEFFCFPTQYDITGVTFIEMHRPIDLVMRKAGPILFAVILSIHTILAILFFVEKSKRKGLLVIASVIFLFIDTFIALKLNGPLNDLFLTWTPATIPADWSALRDQWLDYHIYRNICITLGIISIFLIYYVNQLKQNITQVD